ncbi:MAG: multicopper oxidase family protein [Candidatus Puniceispirillaceae bacterium]
MKRRSFIKAGMQAGVMTAMFSALPLPSLAAGVRRYAITAAPAAQHLGPTDRPATDLWLYGGTSPGPMIEARRGEDLEIEFLNNLDVPTTMHWHGIRNLNEMDGVPDLTQAAIEPGERFTYRFPLRDAGSFWYHAHNKGWEQLARGLYGPLIVRDTDEPLGPRDITLVADDWRLDEDYQLHEDSFGSLMDWSHQGRLGNWLTVNGTTDPKIPVASGPVRLRLINAANARTLAFRFGNGAPMRIVALDGAPCAAFEVQSVRLAPAQRVDILTTFDEGLTVLEEVSTGDAIGAAQFVDTPDAVTPVPAITDRAWYKRPDTAGARVIDIHMQGGAMGNLDAALFEGETVPLRQLAQEHSKLWAFNGVVGGYDHMLADLALGEVAVLRVRNDTRWEHGMHLHGHHFWVNSREFGDVSRDVLRDTYLMAPGETADLIFIADNPGLWLFHCHMMEHHAAGMGGVISVS